MTWLDFSLSIALFVCVICVWILSAALLKAARRAVAVSLHWAKVSKGWADMDKAVVGARREAKFWRDKWKEANVQARRMSAVLQSYWDEVRSAHAILGQGNCDCHLCKPELQNPGPQSSVENRSTVGCDSDISAGEANSCVFITDYARQPSRINHDVPAGDLISGIGVSSDHPRSLGLEAFDIPSSIPWEDLS